MLGIMTISPPFSRPITLLMVGTSSTISQQEGSVTGNWQPTLQVISQITASVHWQWVCKLNYQIHVLIITAIPFTADTLGFKTYPPAYLSPQASGKNLLIGANFASAGSGYDDKTAILSVRKIQIPSVSSAFFPRKSPYYHNDHSFCNFKYCCSMQFHCLNN